MAEAVKSAYAAELGRAQPARAFVPRAIAIAACLAAAALALLRTAGHIPPVVVVADVAGLALPLGFGVVRLWHRSDDRFAQFLVGAAALWSLAMLSQSSDSVLYSIGRTSSWVFLAALECLLLLFPAGRVTGLRDRRLLIGVVATAAVLFLPTALIAEFPTPSPYSPCGAHCPANAFNVAGSTPGFIHDVLVPFRELIAVVLFAAVAGSVAQRTRSAGTLTRRTLAPVAVAAIGIAVILAIYLGSRRVEVGKSVAGTLGDISLFLLPAITLCFGFGMLLRRLFVADVLERLARLVRPHVRAAELRRAMADALQDPQLVVVYWAGANPGRWVDESGWPVEPPVATEGRAITEVRSEDRLRAAIVHDADLKDHRDIVGAVSGYALTAMENERLAGELSDSLRELSESRARVIAVADRQRRKIASDLHDGAQQRLVALRAKLGLLAERADSEGSPLAEPIGRLGSDVDATVDEVRSFARCIYPALLRDRGLSDALRAAGRSAAVPTIVDAAHLPRYPREIEEAVYFGCIEALQNAAKHARGLNGVVLMVTVNGDLHFSVSDDGAGFDPLVHAEGAGLTNLRDRMSAVGGTVEVTSSPAHGTRVTGTIPAAPRRSGRP